MTKKVFISQPMNGKTGKDILLTRRKEIEKIKEYFNDDVEIINNYIIDDVRHYTEAMSENAHVKYWNIYWLASSIKKMAQADVLWLCDGWQDANGCIIECDVASIYGIDTLYPKPKEN